MSTSTRTGRARPPASPSPAPRGRVQSAEPAEGARSWARERPLPERRRADQAGLIAWAPGCPARPPEPRAFPSARPSVAVPAPRVWSEVRLRGHQPPSAPADALAHPKRYWARPSGGTLDWPECLRAVGRSGTARNPHRSPLAGRWEKLPPAESRQHQPKAEPRGLPSS